MSYQVQEDEEGWKLIADMFFERCQHTLLQFAGMNPSLVDSSLASFSDAFKLLCVFLAEHPGEHQAPAGQPLIYTTVLVLCTS